MVIGLLIKLKLLPLQFMETMELDVMKIFFTFNFQFIVSLNSLEYIHFIDTFNSLFYFVFNVLNTVFYYKFILVTSLYYLLL